MKSEVSLISSGAGNIAGLHISYHGLLMDILKGKMTKKPARGRNRLNTLGDLAEK